MAADYAVPAVDPCYGNIVRNLFATRAAEPEPASGVEATIWSEQLSGTTISGDMGALMDPQEETETVDGGAEYYNDMTAQYAATGSASNSDGTAETPAGTADEDLIMYSSDGSDGGDGTSGEALVNVGYDLQTGHSVMVSQVTAPSAGSISVCFAAGTPVLLANGTTKPIEQIARGERVRAASHEDPEGPLSAGEVVEVYHHEPRSIIEVEVDGQVIRCTPKHPFYVRGRGFTAAAELRPGDSLRAASGGWVAVGAVVNNGEVEPVFNIQVAGLHTYFVGDAQAAVLVHNDSGNTAATEVRTDFQAMPANRINAMIADGLATRSTSNPDIVTVVDVIGKNVVEFVFQRYSTGGYAMAYGAPGVVTYVPRETYYRLVATVKFSPIDDPNALPLATRLQKLRSVQEANLMASAQAEQDKAGRQNAIAGTITFAYHLAPFGAAFDNAAQGNWGEASISLAGDAAFFLTGPFAAIAKTAKVPANLRVAGATIEGSVAAYRACARRLCVAAR